MTWKPPEEELISGSQWAPPPGEIISPQPGASQQMVDMAAADLAPKSNAGGYAGAVTRAATPYATGAVVGGLAGSVVPGAGTATGTAAGVTGVALAQFLGDPLVWGVNKAFGTKFTQPTEALTKFFDSLGVEKPDSASEKFAQILTEGVASGYVSSGVSASKQMASGGIAAVTGEGARQTAEGMGAGPVGQTAASLGFGVGAGLATQPRAPRNAGPTQSMNLGNQTELARMAARGDDAAKRTLAAQAATDIDPATLRAAQDLGVAEYLSPGQLTANKHFDELENAIARFPDSALSDQRARAIHEMSRKTNEVIQDLAGIDDAKDTGVVFNRVKSTLRQAVDTVAEREKALYGEVNSSVKRNARVPPQRALDYFNTRLQELGWEPNAKDAKFAQQSRANAIAALTPLERKLYRMLRPNTRLVEGRITEVPPTYGMIDTARREAGDAFRGTGEFSNTNEGIAKHLYGILSDDQGDALDALGGNKALWEVAKSATRQRKAIEDSMITLFGKQLDESMSNIATGATNALAKGDVERWNKMMDAVPRELRPSVSAGAISNMILKNAVDGEFNYPNLIKWYEAVNRNSQAKGALFQTLTPEARVGLRNIYQVAKTIFNTGAKNQDAYVRSALAQSDSLMQNLYFTAFKVSGIQAFSSMMQSSGLARAGAYRMGMEIPAALMANKNTRVLKKVNRMLGSPEFQDLVRAMADGRPLEKYVNKLARSQMMMSFIRETNRSTKQEDIRAYIYQGMDAGPQ